jgi:DNA-binding NarL/FixJ family response regulator
MAPITVAIAHRDKATRAACLRLLQPEKGIRVVGEVRSGLEVLTAITRHKPHILLLDLNLAKVKGIALIRALRQKSPRTKIILITRRSPQSRILEALSHGARGYLEEKAMTTFLAKAVSCVDAGEAWVPRKMVAKIIDRLALLTTREG